MNVLDWSILAVFLLALCAACVGGSRLMSGVSGYLVANRCAGRYLLTLTEGTAGMGAITVIGTFEIFFGAGFVAGWCGHFLAPLGLFVGLSGRRSYPIRQSRAMP